MGKYIAKSNAYSTLAGTLTDIATTLTVQTGHGDRFPEITGTNYTYITLEDGSNNIEVVKVTARAAASDSMTIVRAQDGSSARAWSIGDMVECRPTAGVINDKAGLTDDNSLAGVQTLLKALNTARATVASHATTGDIWGAAGNQVDWTGTATTTAFPNAPQAGAERTLICAGACAFTAGANMLIDGVGSGSTVTCATNDKVIVRAISTTQFSLTRIKYDGTPQVPSPGTCVRSARTSNTIIGAADATTLIDITGASTFTQTFTDAATLGSGWYCLYRNSGTGVVTLDPNGSETIDGVTSFAMYPQECRLIQCDGTGFNSVVLSPFYWTVTTTSTFVKPPGYSSFGGLLWGGGGAGPKTNSASKGGGGGAFCLSFTVRASVVGTTETVTIAAGGVGPTSNANGGNGGDSTFGSLFTAYGGGGGKTDGKSGGGGGIFSAGGVDTASSPAAASTGAVGYEGTLSTASLNATKIKTIWGGASGAYSDASPVNIVGGDSIWGGAGGGGIDENSGLLAAGTSKFGGPGGAAATATSGVDGTAPGGGGGATKTGTKGGDGGRGECRIWGIA